VLQVLVHLYKHQDLRDGGRPQQGRQLDGQKEVSIVSGCRACLKMDKGQNAAYVVHWNE
jgi:hypothetical protein